MLGNHRQGSRKLSRGEYAVKDMQKLYFQLGSDKWVRIHQAGGREKEECPGRDPWRRKSTYYEGYYEASQEFELYQWEIGIHWCDFEQRMDMISFGFYKVKGKEDLESLWEWKRENQFKDNCKMLLAWATRYTVIHLF